MRLIDTHCHLDDERYAADLPVVLSRAREAGVGRFITIGTDIAAGRAAVALAEQHDDVWATVGIHPHETTHVTADDWQALDALMTRPKVVAVGEFGLDYHREHAPRPAQRAAFERQLALAQQHRLPIVLHCREAWEDCLAILRNVRPSGWQGAAHCFSGDHATAEACVALGLLISFSGTVTFKNAAAVRRVAAAVPVTHLLTETDAPYLAPQPVRGERNEPAHVRLVAEQLAQLKGMTSAELCDQVWQNAEGCFRFHP